MILKQQISSLSFTVLASRLKIQIVIRASTRVARVDWGMLRFFRASFGAMLIILILIFNAALASPVKLEGQALVPPLETRDDLDSDPNLTLLDERLSLTDFERLGVRSELFPSSTRLSRGTARLEFSEGSGGWALGGLKLPGLRPPVVADGTVWIPVRVLAYLGFNLSIEGDTILVSSLNASSTTGTIKAEPPVAATNNQITTTRVNRGVNTRIVLELTQAAAFESSIAVGRSSVRLRGVEVSPRLIVVGSEAVVRARLIPDGEDAILDLETNPKANIQVFALAAPDRIVIDAQVPPGAPPVPGPTPQGIATLETGLGAKKLTLVTIDPARYSPKLSVAPWGGALRVLEHAQAMGAVVAANAGYFDPSSNLPVDLALSEGGVRAYARGNRSTLGLHPDGVPMFGTPKVRLNFSFQIADGTLDVPINSIRPEPNPKWITSFVGDGFVPVGGDGFVTLVISSHVSADGSLQPMVVDIRDGLSVPEPGELTVTYSSEAQPALDSIEFGSSTNVTLQWSDPSWTDVQHAIAAGPKLITNGQYVVNPQLEGFDPTKDIWRSTRQVGFGLDVQGRYVIALLEQGTPEEFAKALLLLGLREAMRFDSGSSASVYLAGGMVGGKWGRTVPNALVFVPKQ
jgi:Phosphodiester glycosidase